ncbi:hypothetical protein EMIT0180MI3_10450 [Priestia megaterium]
MFKEQNNMYYFLRAITYQTNMLTEFIHCGYRNIIRYLLLSSPFETIY